jgi:RNA polymerase sigma-70 factor (ECF subfamily)
LRSAAHRREAYFGEWLPEPVVTRLEGADPLSVVVANEDARFAAMVVLERLTPDQRVAFVLHDGFAVPFGDIADVLGVEPASARQLASRARRLVADAEVPARDASHDEVVGKLMAAMASGDLTAVVALLHPDVTFTGDSNRMAPTAARVIHGSDKVARFILGLVTRYGPKMFEAGQLALVNGELGLYNERVDTDGEWAELQPHIQALTVRDGLVCAIWDVANPEKFTASPLAGR